VVGEDDRRVEPQLGLRGEPAMARGVVEEVRGRAVQGAHRAVGQAVQALGVGRGAELLAHAIQQDGQRLGAELGVERTHGAPELADPVPDALEAGAKA
jgi:hypothetical protein